MTQFVTKTDVTPSDGSKLIELPEADPLLQVP